jgi:hypothetical protein
LAQIVLDLHLAESEIPLTPVTNLKTDATWFAGLEAIGFRPLGNAKQGGKAKHECGNEFHELSPPRRRSLAHNFSG